MSITVVLLIIIALIRESFSKPVNISLILRMTLSFHLILLLLNWLMTLATFFDRLKIVDIRSNFPDLNNPETGCMEREAYLTSCFSEFVTLEKSEVHRVISSSNLKSCV